MSTPARLWQDAETSERATLIRRHSVAEPEIHAEEMDYESTQPAAGGTVLGIHNLAIVFPQFFVSLISTAIFRAADDVQGPEVPGEPGNVYYGKNGVAWVLRFGGVCALIGALMSRRVPPTKTEKAMRRRRAEMDWESAESP